VGLRGVAVLPACAQAAQLKITHAATHITLIRLIIRTPISVAYPNYSNRHSCLHANSFMGRPRQHPGTLIELMVDEDA
jgi:hypothetical protein